MNVLDLFRIPDTTAVDEATQAMTTADLTEQLQQATATLEFLEESLADVELGLEDRGWRTLSVAGETEFTRSGLLTAARLCRVMAVVNPLIRRGLNLRTAYVWGDGVQITARATGQNDTNDAEQDVNTVVQEFLDDPATQKVLTSASARERNERTLGTDGMLALALFTKPLSGRVQPREIPSDEITDVITNPEDSSEVWFYKRVWIRKSPDHPQGETVTTFYPDVEYRPRGPKPIRVNLDAADPGTVAAEIMWDAPIAFLKVNDLSGWDFGIGDAFSAIAWAKAYKEFLEDWAKLVKSLSRFAWRLTASTKSRAQKAADTARTTVPGATGDTGVGALAAGSLGGGQLEAIPKSGATIDSESGKPLAAMVASGLDVPVTMLLADPGVTGARATAETLDRPTVLMATMRRNVWGDFHTKVLDYVIDQAVKAPRGALQGTVSRDEWGREVITLAGDTPRTIEHDWPDLTEVGLKDLVAAISEADGTGKLPPVTTLKLLLQALGVKDVDEIIEAATDDDGNWIDPEMTAGQAAVDAFNRGEDPAGAVR